MTSTGKERIAMIISMGEKGKAVDLELRTPDSFIVQTQELMEGKSMIRSL